MQKTGSGFTITHYLLISAGATAQTTGSVKGKITTSEGNPASHANITIEGSSNGAEADEDGKFEIRNLRPGTYTLTVSAVGLANQNIR